MRASSRPMPNEAPVIRAVLVGAFSIQHLAFSAWQRTKAGPEDPPLRLGERFRLHMGQRRFSLIDRMPRGRRFQFVVDVVDVLHALGFQPLAERRGTLLGVDRDTIFPSSASAEDAVELHA